MIADIRKELADIGGIVSKVSNTVRAVDNDLDAALRHLEDAVNLPRTRQEVLDAYLQEVDRRAAQYKERLDLLIQISAKANRKEHDRAPDILFGYERGAYKFIEESLYYFFGSQIKARLKACIQDGETAWPQGVEDGVDEATRASRIKAAEAKITELRQLKADLLESIQSAGGHVVV